MWSIEVAFEDAKQTTGVGQARNRLSAAVTRTVPFGLIWSTLANCWYAHAGYDPADVEHARAQAPWRRTKAQPSVADMLSKLRRFKSPPNFGTQTPNRPPPPKSISSAWPGATSPHRCESRDYRRC